MKGDNKEYTKSCKLPKVHYGLLHLPFSAINCHTGQQVTRPPGYTRRMMRVVAPVPGFHNMLDGVYLIDRPAIGGRLLALPALTSLPLIHRVFQHIETLS